MTTLQHLENSAIATVVAEVATLPICTLKTNHQNTHSTSIAGTAITMYRTGGILSFYRASIPSILSQVLSTSSKYLLYRKLEEVKYPYTNKSINGITSGVISSLLTHPIDVIKIHWQMRNPLMPVLKECGISVLYRGYNKNLQKVGISSASFFPLYDAFYERTRSSVYSSFASALISTTVVHPFDYAKTRYIYGIKDMTGGPFKGLSLNLMRVVPHFMIMMTTISYLSSKQVNE